MICRKCETPMEYEPATSDGSGRKFPASWYCDNEDCPDFSIAVEPEPGDEYDMQREIDEALQVRRTTEATRTRCTATDGPT